MYAQVRRYHSLRGGHAADQVCRDIEQSALPRFEKVPGFIDYFVLELTDGGLATVSIYENAAGVEAGKKVSADWNKTAAAGALPERPDETFEGPVRIYHRGRKEAAA